MREAERFLRLSEVAENLRVSEATLVRWSRKGEFPGFKPGERTVWLVKSEDLDDWVEQRKTATRRSRLAAGILKDGI